jgi:hypothetical protein
VRAIQVVTSEGPRGPVYIRFSSEPISQSEPAEFEDDLIVDYDAQGGVVGVELVSIDLGVFNALVEVARSNELDLAALLSRSFAVSPAA